METTECANLHMTTPTALEWEIFQFPVACPSWIRSEAHIDVSHPRKPLGLLFHIRKPLLFHIRRQARETSRRSSETSLVIKGACSKIFGE